MPWCRRESTAKSHTANKGDRNQDTMDSTLTFNASWIVITPHRSDGRQHAAKRIIVGINSVTKAWGTARRTLRCAVPVRCRAISTLRGDWVCVKANWSLLTFTAENTISSSGASETYSSSRKHTAGAVEASVGPSARSKDKCILSIRHVKYEAANSLKCNFKV